MKKILAFVLSIIMVFSLAGCTNNKMESELQEVKTALEVANTENTQLKSESEQLKTENEQLKTENEQLEAEKEKAQAMVDKALNNMQEVSEAPSKYYSRSDFKKIADNFYEVEYYDYDLDYILKGPSAIELEKLLSSIYNAGCTAVRKDNYYGRNLDFVYGDLAEVLVKVKAKEGRYANIGITGGFSYMTPDAIDRKYLDIASQACLPLMICDGINEKGVVCNVNVVPANDLETWTIGTNPSAHDLNMYSIPRFVLDGAASAKEAIELLKTQNIWIPWDACDLNPKGMEFHFMIADNENTYVVEFINNKMEVIDLTNEHDKIMTNFYLYYKDNKTPHSSGVERFEKIKEQYDSINTVDDMKKAMESVKFSQCYGDENGENIWYSDNGFVTDDGTVITYDNYEPYVEELKEKSKEHRKKLNEAVASKTNEKGYWITMHTSVFDIENKTMEVAIQERYNDGYYKFKVE